MSQAKHRLPPGHYAPAWRHWIPALVLTLLISTSLALALRLSFGVNALFVIPPTNVLGGVLLWFYLSNRPPDNKHERN